MLRTDIEGRKAQVKKYVALLEKKFFEFRKQPGNDWRTPQSDWARHLGVDNATLSSWMRGSRLPSPQYIHYLGDPSRLGDDVYDVFPEVPRPMPEDEETKQLVAMFEKLPGGNARKKALALVAQLLEEQEAEAARKGRSVPKPMLD